MRLIGALCLTLLLIVAACDPVSREVPSRGRGDEKAMRFEQAERPVGVTGGSLAGRASSVVRAQMASAAEDVSQIRLTPERSEFLIRTAQASIEVDSLERAVTKVRLLAERVGGFVANTTMQTGPGQPRAATLELKIPVTRFDEGLGGLAGVGKLESVNVNAEDVGEEFTDVTARVGNARRLEERLLALLATRTGRLKDVLDVERELARVRAEIDRYEGRLRYLRAHVDRSTLAISVHEPVPVVGRAGSSVMGDAVKQAWRNFVELAAFTVRALGIVLPLGLVAMAAWFGLKRRRAQAHA